MAFELNCHSQWLCTCILATVQRRWKAFAPLSSSAKQNNAGEQLALENHFAFCLMSTHKKQTEMELPGLKWFCQESNLHKITMWRPTETSKTCSSDNSNIQTDGPTTGVGQRTLLIPSNEEQKYPQGNNMASLHGMGSFDGSHSG